MQVVAFCNVKFSAMGSDSSLQHCATSIIPAYEIPYPRRYTFTPFAGTKRLPEFEFVKRRAVLGAACEVSVGKRGDCKAPEWFLTTLVYTSSARSELHLWKEHTLYVENNLENKSLATCL